MNYGLLFLGICLVIMAIIMFILDAAKNRSEIRELERANAQTEMLIEELNELSSIIVDEMDKRYNSMLGIYKELLVATEPERSKQEACPDYTPGTEGTKPQDKKSRVLELHNDGKTPSEIASVLGMGIGEVELIIKFAGQGAGNSAKGV
mgnify:CR=1 FL=1|jgi:hypothetical protein